MSGRFDILALLATLAALWAAWEASRAANATKDTAEAALAVSFFNDYFAPEMANALRVLRRWRDDNGDQFAHIWIERLSGGDPKAQEVDNARRRVKGYFEKTTRLFSGGLIRLKVFRCVAYVAGLNLYYDIIDPLELALNPNRDSSAKDSLSSTLGRYTEAEHVQPVPTPNKTHILAVL